MGRAPCCEKVGLKRGRWTAEEDAILTKYIQAHGEGSWRSLPKNAGLLRCGKSCRLRWTNYLRADLKRGNITPEEEELIVKLHSTLGNKWSLIASHLPGRTDNEIKNYWNSHLRRKIYTFTRLRNDDHSPVTNLDAVTIPARGIRSGGRTSKSAMKKRKHMLHEPWTGATTQTLEKPTYQKKTTPPSTTAGHYQDSQIMGSPSGSQKHSEEDERNISMHEFCMDSAVEGLDERETVPSDVGFWPTKEMEPEEFGPYEWLDSEVKRLSRILQREEGGYRTLNKQAEGGVMGVTEGRDNGVMAQDSMTTSDEDAHGCTVNWRSNGESNNKWLQPCSSPANPGIDNEWFDCQNQWDFCGEGDKMLVMLWDSDNGEKGCH